MDPAFRIVGVIAKHGDPGVGDTVRTLVSHLEDRGVQVILESAGGDGAAAVTRTTLGRECDLVIVVAGDGTFLGAARTLVEHGVPLLGVNLGRLGFLADIMPGEMLERLDEILAGRYQEERRFLLHVEVRRAGATVAEMTALNEAVVHKGHIARLITLGTYIDARLVSNQRSDGVIVATPTGSTAYALSGGGPLLQPDLDAMVLVPICPHTLSSRPLVVHGSADIELRVDATEQPVAQLACDGQVVIELSAGDTVHIRKLDRELRLIHPPGHDHYATLRAKLHWAREL